MKRSTFFIFGVICSLMISFIGMTSCAKSSTEEQSEEQSEKQCKKQCEKPAKHGILEIWEVYDPELLKPALEAVNEMTEEDETPLHVILSYYYSYGASVGQAFYHDTIRINEILNSKEAKALFPEDIRFVWTKHPINPRGGFYQLIALQAKDGGPAMYGDLIKDAYVEEASYGEWAVTCEFNETAAKDFQDLTRYNVNRNLAVVIDGKVYCYPHVMDEISGGKCQISAPFEDEDEALQLAKRLVNE